MGEKALLCVLLQPIGHITLRSKLHFYTNLGVVLDNQLSCTANITAVARSCKFTLYNFHRIQPFFTREAAKLLVQELIIYRNSLLAGLPLSTIKTSAAYPECRQIST